MKKSLYLVIATLALLSGCSHSGSSADPPVLTTTAGDGRVKVTWTPVAGIDYWIFTATDAALTAFNWTGLSDGHAYTSAQTPFYMCGLLDGTTSYFASNARTNGGPGGASSATVGATPLLLPRSSSAWSSVPVSSTSDLYGVGYAGQTRCSNIATSAAGSFAVVGASGIIATSNVTDGFTGISTWTVQSINGGFPHNLYSVAGYAANQNTPTNPGLHWVAVGDGGATFLSTDAGSAIWTAERAYSASNPALRDVINVGTAFWAVGDADSTPQGTILSSSDGSNWTSHTSNTTHNLRAITHGISIYVAVGDNGTILTSSDGSTWTAQTSHTTENLRQVSSFLQTYVAVGDNGTVVTSTDDGANWTAQTISATPLVGIAANLQLATLNSAGAAYTSTTTGITANQQFVAVDSGGYYYTSTDGVTWSAATSTLTSSLNALVSSGFGYVTVGSSGVAATAF